MSELPQKRAVVDAGGDDTSELIAMLGEIGVEATAGKIIACEKCGFFDCVCGVMSTHKKKCRFRVSMCCPVGVDYKHGFEVCPECGACDCGGAP